MQEPAAVVEVTLGQSLRGTDGRRIGRVEGIFADYLLVRTASLLPVDLYVPRADVEALEGELRVSVDRAGAYESWHRPLKRTSHD
ncbi:MAG: hypothetical protein ABIZ71_13190 [Gemmatimonadales bacterium]